MNILKPYNMEMTEIYMFFYNHRLLMDFSDIQDVNIHEVRHHILKLPPLGVGA